MKSPYRLDHEKVIVAEGDSLLAVIPLSARNMVLTLCEYMNWQAFWRVNPPSKLEWDNIQSIIAELEQAMSTALSVQNLLVKMDDQTAAMDNQTAAIQTLCECIVASYVANPGTWPIEQPDPNGDYIDILPGMAEPPTSEPLAGNHSCLVAGDLIDRMANTLESLAPYANLGAGALVVVSLLLILAIPYAGVYAITAITAAGIWSAVMTYTSSGLLAQAGTLRSNRQAMVCEVDDWDIWLDSHSQITSFLQGMRGLFGEYGAPAGETIASLMYTKNTANFIADNLASYTGDCGCEEVDYLNYHLDQEQFARVVDQGAQQCDTPVFTTEGSLSGIQIGNNESQFNWVAVGIIPPNTLSGLNRIRYSWWTKSTGFCKGEMQLQRFDGTSWVGIGGIVTNGNSYLSLKYTGWSSSFSVNSAEQHRLLIRGGSTISNCRSTVFVHLQIATGL